MSSSNETYGHSGAELGGNADEVEEVDEVEEADELVVGRVDRVVVAGVGLVGVGIDVDVDADQLVGTAMVVVDLFANGSSMVLSSAELSVDASSMSEEFGTNSRVEVVGAGSVVVPVEVRPPPPLWTSESVASVGIEDTGGEFGSLLEPGDGVGTLLPFAGPLKLLGRVVEVTSPVTRASSGP